MHTRTKTKREVPWRFTAAVLAVLMAVSLCPGRVYYAEDIPLEEAVHECTEVFEELVTEEIPAVNENSEIEKPVMEENDIPMELIEAPVEAPAPISEADPEECISIREEVIQELPPEPEAEEYEEPKVLTMVSEPAPDAELTVYLYPWQGKDDVSLAEWVRSDANTGYVLKLMTDTSGERAEERTLFEERIRAVENTGIRDDIFEYVKTLEEPETCKPETEPSVIQENTITEEFMEDSTENDSEVPGEIAQDQDLETEDPDPTGETASDSADTEHPIFIAPEEIMEEPPAEAGTEETASKEPVQKYVWDYPEDADFKTWVFDKTSQAYIKQIYSETEDPEILAEKEAFEIRIESVASDKGRQEIREAVAAATARKPLLLAAKASPVTYIKGRENAVRFIEESLIARKTSFTLYYEYNGVLESKDVRPFALELLNEADGAYLDTYSGNGNGSDYLAYQVSAGCGGTTVMEQTSSVTRLCFSYTARYYDTAEEEAQVQLQAASLLSSLGIARMGSAYDKAWAIYDWITSNVQYGYCADDPQNHPYSSYGALIEKKAVCQGISALVYKLMNDAGIPCRTMASASHNWNAVKIDGAWYIVDATNGTLGKDYYFLLGTDTYSRYQQPASGYSDMWNTLSKRSYEEEHAATTGVICKNVRWTVSGNVLTLEPADPSQYSSLRTTREEVSDWHKEVVSKQRNYISTVIIQNIDDYGASAALSEDYFITGLELSPSHMIHKGKFPSNAYIYTGDDSSMTITVPCQWTDANVKKLGLYWYWDGTNDPNSSVWISNGTVWEHPNLNPNGPKIVKTHDFSVIENRATCTEPGGAVLQCSFCGTKQETDVSLPALGHDYSETERKESTCREEGYSVSKCARCGDVKTEMLSKTEHTWTETSRTEPTCEKDGKTVYTCEVCKNTKEETLKTLGHQPVAMPSTETTTGGVKCGRCGKILEEPVKGISLSLNGVGKGETVYINGLPYIANANNQVILPTNIRNCTSAVTYSFSSGSGGSYPVGMKVWILSQDANTGLITAERASYLDNLMKYSGTSIRLKGNQGIAIHTDVVSGTWNALTGDGHHGYKVQEAGLLVTKTFENDTPIYGGAGVIKGMAYDRNGSIRSVNPDGNRCYYMNTLVFGNDMEKTKWNLACRPYMILKDSGGREVILYGGILVRSVRSVAQQIQPMYVNDPAVSAFIQKILSA